MIQKKPIAITILLFLIPWACYCQARAVPAAGLLTAGSPWFKNAVIFNLDIEVFKDSDGDGVGDIKGLTQKLGYLNSLGVDVIWLAPFQPTPNKDDGYDVSDYYGIDQRLGTWKDFSELIAKANSLHLKIIMDLVLNHSSNEHPWFLQSKNAASPYRTWYSWSQKRPANYNKGMGFPGVEKETWTYDSTAKAWYYHRFYTFQPDLDANNPEVQKEVRKIITFWMGKGLSGFRVDAVPFFIEVPKTKGRKFERNGGLLTPIRALIDSLKENAIFLGEINVPPAEDKIYFGERGERMNMILNFYVNQQMFYALATAHAKPLKKALRATGNNPANTAWGQFLRNHDEVDLGRLSRHRRRQVFKKFGPDTSMQLYGRGIRRRLAPMLKSRQKIELAYSLLLSSPATTLIRYGEELGMGDNLALKERLSVRTPMQWSEQKNAGFTVADNPVRPIIDSGAYSYLRVNAADEMHDKNSLLNWTKAMILLRKSLPEIAYGSWEILNSGRHVLVIRYTLNGKKVIVVHNFSERPVTISLKQNGVLVDLLDYDHHLLRLKRHNKLEIPGLGYKWYRVN